MIITDYKMPNMNGVEIIKKVKEEKPKAIIYLLTGFYDEDIVKIARESGATGIMNKPFEVSKIVSILSYL